MDFLKVQEQTPGNRLLEPECTQLRQELRNSQDRCAAIASELQQARMGTSVVAGAPPMSPASEFQRAQVLCASQAQEIEQLRAQAADMVPKAALQRLQELCNEHEQNIKRLQGLQGGRCLETRKLVHRVTPDTPSTNFVGQYSDRGFLYTVLQDGCSVKVLCDPPQSDTPASGSVVDKKISILGLDWHYLGRSHIMVERDCLEKSASSAHTLARASVTSRADHQKGDPTLLPRVQPCKKHGEGLS